MAETNRVPIEQLKNEIKQGQMPRHIAIIMDGNGRWATARKLERVKGHAAGTKIIRKMIDCASQLGVEVLTLYCFSTENWRRPLKEISFLMELIRGYLKREADDMVAEGVQLRHVGDLDPIPANVRAEILRVEEMTTACSKIVLNIAINYGGRQEILAATQALCQQVAAGELSVDDIDEDCFSHHLQTVGLPDPDLVIRTSGEQRLSNYLLWQTAYAEMYFTKTQWPDFGEHHLCEAIRAYQQRHRRFGGLDTRGPQ